MRRSKLPRLALAAALLSGAFAPAGAQTANDALRAEIERRSGELAGKVTEWRHDIHQYPELSFQETRTAAKVAAHLRALGLEVKTNVGGNGVVGILRGGLPGPVVALRADMDALPMTELVDLPFKSTVKAIYNGAEVGVMHACGHDMHTAMLMGAAELLTGMKAKLPGTVKFIFQPAEEGPPIGGAGPMIAEGVLENPKVDAIFGLHVGPELLGSVGYHGGAAQASTDNFKIIVRGKQTHGAMPWTGIDPIVVSAQIVLGLQSIVSRQINISAAPGIVTVGAIHGGLRENIIPDSVEMIGTVRALDPQMRLDIHQRLRRTVESIAMGAGATATVDMVMGYPVLVNEVGLTERLVPTLRYVAGAEMVKQSAPILPSEDFSRYLEKVPGSFFGLGAAPRGRDLSKVSSGHSPLFEADDAALPIGMRLMATVALDFLSGTMNKPAK